MGPRHEHTICFLFGHEWPDKTCNDADIDDGAWPEYICKFCEAKIGLPMWDGTPEGWVWQQLYFFKIWACGYFLGHNWQSWEIADSGEYDSACDRCGVKGDDCDDDDRTIFQRIRDWEGMEFTVIIDYSGIKIKRS